MNAADPNSVPPPGELTQQFVVRAGAPQFSMEPKRYTPWDLIGVFAVLLGIPVAGGVWSVWKIGQQLGWW